MFCLQWTLQVKLYHTIDRLRNVITDNTTAIIDLYRERATWNVKAWRVMEELCKLVNLHRGGGNDNF